MKEIINDILRWQRDNKRVALARVVDVEGSGPRDPGAAMAVNEDGEVAGSVSGGCVEGAVVAEALAILGGAESRIVTFGYSDDEAFAVGLTCGGTIHLFIEPLPDIVAELTVALRAEDPVALVSVVAGLGVGSHLLVYGDGRSTGSLGNPELDRVAERDARGELEVGRSGVRHYGPHGEQREEAVSVFVESFAAPPQMLIFGAVDFTAALVRVAKLLGYRVTVADARAVFATKQRFPWADEVMVSWPDGVFDAKGDDLGPLDAVCVLTHDNKFDVPAVMRAVQTPVGYIGVMGSRRTHENRLERLREAGITDEDVAR